MKLRLFHNEAGKNIVAFEPWNSSSFFCHLTVNGQPIYEYGSPCGTCGIVFRNVGAIEQRVSDSEAVKLLGPLEDLPTKTNLVRLARILPKGEYYTVVLSGIIERVEPGSEDDFFVTDVTRLFGQDNEPAGSDIPYFRFTLHHELVRSSSPHQYRTAMQRKALVSSVIMPLHSPEMLVNKRVEYWKHQIQRGNHATAFAITIIDRQAPADGKADSTYPYEEQILVANCLIDGHHRVQAATELGTPLRLLSFVSIEYSLISGKKEFRAVLEPFSH